MTAEDRAALADLDTEGWWQLEKTREPVREALMRAAAWYFLHARNSRGAPVDPVARFHLGNGARLEQINFLADGSENGLRQSHGLMVNYHYDLDDIEKNHEAYAEQSHRRGLERGAQAGAFGAGRARAAGKLSGTGADGADAMNLFEIIRGRIKSPAKLFLESETTRLSYADMLDRTAQLANILVLSGVEPGDRVAVQVEKTPENLLLYLACLRAGAVYLPLNTAYTLAELDYFIGDAEPRLDRLRSVQDAMALPRLRQSGGVGAVETLDAKGKGRSDGGRCQGAEGFRRRAARRRRSRRHSLHVGHHWPLERRDADAPQSRLQCADPDRFLALHGRRRPAARAADLSHAWSVRGQQHRDAGRRRR